MPGDLSIGQLLSLYRQMLTIRRTEEQIARSYQAGLIPGACHTYVGEEAIAAGVCAHLRTDDTIFSTHRGHGHALAKGVPIRELIAELYGKSTGCARGRGGSMHLFSPEIGLMGTSGIVGPSILQAAGAAYTFRMLETDCVSVAFFGDGGVNNGAFHEGLNMAAIWQLPVIFVLEDNRYATEVAFEYATRNTNIAERAEGYGVTGVRVDGNDVLDVYEKPATPSFARGKAAALRCWTARPTAPGRTRRGCGIPVTARGTKWTPGERETRSRCWQEN